MPDPLAAPVGQPGLPHSPGWRLAGLIAVLTVAGLAAYANTFGAPFVFDDVWAIPDNPTIRHLGNLREVLSPVGVTIAGRPLVNLLMALNYAWSGTDVWSYHVVNLGLHLLAALALFGVLRRTLRSAGYPQDVTPPSLFIVLLWLLHPLQTNAVTYISQRAESLMALFYLLTIYCFIRSTTLSGSTGWRWLSVLCCFAGVATKEVIVTAPALVLLYDRVFIAGSFRGALAQRRWYYGALASSWGLLAYFMVASKLAVRTGGFDAGVSGFTYALNSARVLVLYVKLAVWPSPLVFDYGREFLVRAPLPLVPYALLVGAALAGTVLLFVRGWRALGFLAAAFFILLSPTTSIVPIIEQPMAESRMYLPLAVLSTLLVLGLYRAWPRLAPYVLGGLALLLLIVTLARNQVYQTGVSLYSDALAKSPRNSRVHYNLANELAKIPGRQQEAIAQFREALRLRPDLAWAHNNLAVELAKDPAHVAEAIEHYETALRLRSDLAETHSNLANELSKLPGRQPEAFAHYEESLRLKPDYAESHYNYGNELAKIPARVPEAIAHLEAALKLRPDFPEAQSNLANILDKIPGREADAIAHHEAFLRLQPFALDARLRLAGQLAALPGRQGDAVAHYEQVLRVLPNQAEAHLGLARVLEQLPGRLPEAITHYEAALQLTPGLPEVRNNLAIDLAKIPGRQAEALAQFEAALKLKPDYAEAHANLANELAHTPGRQPEALPHYAEALRLKPDYAEAHCNYANQLVNLPGRRPEALQHYQEAIRLKPDYAQAHNNLGLLLAALGRLDEAAAHLETALTLNPGYARARAALEQIRAQQRGQK